jgi:hypothetical protein
MFALDAPFDSDYAPGVVRAICFHSDKVESGSIDVGLFLDLESLTG